MNQKLIDEARERASWWASGSAEVEVKSPDRTRIADQYTRLATALEKAEQRYQMELETRIGLGAMVEGATKTAMNFMTRAEAAKNALQEMKGERDRLAEIGRALLRAENLERDKSWDHWMGQLQLALQFDASGDTACPPEQPGSEAAPSILPGIIRDGGGFKCWHCDVWSNDAFHVNHEPNCPFRQQDTDIQKATVSDEDPSLPAKQLPPRSKPPQPC